MSEIDAYKDGLNAAYRFGRYLGAKDTPDCPLENGSKESDAWWSGFGDGTEDLIFQLDQ